MLRYEEWYIVLLNCKAHPSFWGKSSCLVVPNNHIAFNKREETSAAAAAETASVLKQKINKYINVWHVCHFSFFPELKDEEDKLCAEKEEKGKMKRNPSEIHMWVCWGSLKIVCIRICQKRMHNPRSLLNINVSSSSHYIHLMKRGCVRLGEKVFKVCLMKIPQALVLLPLQQFSLLKRGKANELFSLNQKLLVFQFFLCLLRKFSTLKLMWHLFSRWPHIFF